MPPKRPNAATPKPPRKPGRPSKADAAAAEAAAKAAAEAAAAEKKKVLEYLGAGGPLNLFAAAEAGPPTGTRCLGGAVIAPHRAFPTERPLAGLRGGDAPNTTVESFSHHRVSVALSSPGLYRAAAKRRLDKVEESARASGVLPAVAAAQRVADVARACAAFRERGLFPRSYTRDDDELAAFDDFESIEKLLEFGAGKGSAAVKYGPSEANGAVGWFDGRLYAERNMSMGNVTRALRDFVLTEKLPGDEERFDIDFRACHPSNSHAIATQHNLPCGALRDYLVHYDEWRRVGGAAAKGAVNRAIYTPEYRTGAAPPPTGKTIAPAQRGTKAAVAAVVNELRWITHTAAGNASAATFPAEFFDGKEASAMCELSNRIERANVDAAAAALAAAGVVVEMYRLDGLVVRASAGVARAHGFADARALVADVLRRINDSFDRIPGTHVPMHELVIKPFDAPPADVAAPDAGSFDFTDPLLAQLSFGALVLGSGNDLAPLCSLPPSIVARSFAQLFIPHVARCIGASEAALKNVTAAPGRDDAAPPPQRQDGDEPPAKRARGAGGGDRQLVETLAQPATVARSDSPPGGLAGEKLIQVLKAFFSPSLIYRDTINTSISKGSHHSLVSAAVFCAGRPPAIFAAPAYRELVAAKTPFAHAAATAAVVFDHLRLVLCGGCDAYFSLLNRIVARTLWGVSAGVMFVFLGTGRDGKGMFLNWLRCEVVGFSSSVRFNTFSEYASRFNSASEGKALTVIDEIHADHSQAHIDALNRLKSDITEPVTMKEAKFKAQRESANIGNYMGASNFNPPMPAVDGLHQRIVMSEVDREAGPGTDKYSQRHTDYFNGLAEALGDQRVTAAFAYAVTHPDAPWHEDGEALQRPLLVAQPEAGSAAAATRCAARFAGMTLVEKATLLATVHAAAEAGDAERKPPIGAELTIEDIMSAGGALLGPGRTDKVFTPMAAGNYLKALGIETARRRVKGAGGAAGAAASAPPPQRDGPAPRARCLTLTQEAFDRITRCEDAIYDHARELYAKLEGAFPPRIGGAAPAAAVGGPGLFDF